MPARTLSPNGVVTSVDQLNSVMASRYQPKLFTVPDYDTTIEVQMISAGDQEHCANFARMQNGERDWDIYTRIWVAYGIAAPKLVTDPNRRQEAEKIARLLEDYPKDWINLVFQQSLEMTTEYQRKRAERERAAGEGDTSVVFRRPDSGPTSSQTDSTSSPE